MSPDMESAYLLGQRCANAVLDRRPADAVFELAIVEETFDRIAAAQPGISQNTYRTLTGYRDTLNDYLEERSDR